MLNKAVRHPWDDYIGATPGSGRSETIRRGRWNVAAFSVILFDPCVSERPLNATRTAWEQSYF